MANPNFIYNLVEAINKSDGFDATLDSEELTDLVSRFDSESTVEEGVGEAVLQIDGKSFAEVYWDTGGVDTEIVISTSNDGVTFRELYRYDTTEADTDHQQNEQIPWIARNFIRVEFVSTTGTIDIAASR